VERRSFSGFDHLDIIDAFAKAVPAPHKVNLKQPDKTILVQLIRNVCAVAVAPQYKELCKYNVRVAAEPEEEAEEGAAGAGGGAEGEKQVKAEGQAKAEGAAGEGGVKVEGAATAEGEGGDVKTEPDVKQEAEVKQEEAAEAVAAS